MVSLVVMYGYENWTITKAVHWRIDIFELWCWRRLLRAPWIARRSNQSILKEITPEYSLEGLMLKLQCIGHLMHRVDSLEKKQILQKIEGRGRRGWQRTRWLDVITNSMDRSWASSGRLKDKDACHVAGHAVTKIWIGLSNWTITKSVNGGFPGSSAGKESVMQETQVQFLGREEVPLEKE